MSSSMNRREFLQFSAAAASLLGLAGMPGISIAEDAPIRKPRPIQPGAKVRIAAMGFNNKGFGDVRAFKDEEIVALCDIDWGLEKVQQTFKDFPGAKRYKDFRKMLIEMDERIDALVVSTADHNHFLPAYMAIAMGKHVFVQKPLTQTIWETRELRRMANLHGVCTQMGNQGRQMEGCRLVKEWIAAGVIGPVREVHVWTNRPFWEQGMTQRPDPMPIPAGLDWELFQGRAHERPYNRAYHPVEWRGWVEYGCGALGDMGCHTMDAAYYALELGAPASIEAKASSPIGESFPKWSIITYEFPARAGMPPVMLTWYDGGQLPPRPKDLEGSRKLAPCGQYYLGEKGTIYDGGDYCSSPRLIPEIKMKEMIPHLPPKTIRRADPAGNPHLVWIQAIRKNEPEWANSHFDYSVGLTEMVLLGNLALRAPGRKILWDAEKIEVTNLPELNRFLKPAFRENWGVDELRAAKRKGTEELSTPAQLRDGTPLYMIKIKEEKAKAKAQAQDGKKGQGKKGKGKKQEPKA